MQKITILLMAAIITAIPATTTVLAQAPPSGSTRARCLDVGISLALLDIMIDHADMPNVDATLYEGEIAKDTADIERM